MAGKDDQEWVEVVGVNREEEADLIAGFLESEGIPCEVEGPHRTPFPEDLGSFGVSRVMVPADREQEARTLIAKRQREYESQRRDPDSSEGPEE